MDPIALEEDTPLEGGLKLLIQPCLVIMVLRGCQIRKKQIELRLGNALPVEEHQENSSLLKPTENLLKLLISVDFSRIFSVAVYLFK